METKAESSSNFAQFSRVHARRVYPTIFEPWDKLYGDENSGFMLQSDVRTLATSVLWGEI
jgi:hypothetical protein